MHWRVIHVLNPSSTLFTIPVQPRVRAVCQLDYIRREVDAGRRFQEKDCCPEVFFLIPADTSSWSLLERCERWRIFTQHMQLHRLLRRDSGVDVDVNVVGSTPEPAPG